MNFTQSRVHAETIFKGNNLMKDCRHTCNCCSVEFKSREGLSLVHFAAPYISKRCNYVLMIINTRLFAVHDFKIYIGEVFQMSVN